MSHRAGVLLGNNHFLTTNNEAGMMRNNDDPAMLRELANDSKNSAGCTGNLKSVYDMRVSHSNLAAKNA